MSNNTKQEGWGEDAPCLCVPFAHVRIQLNIFFGFQPDSHVTHKGFGKIIGITAVCNSNASLAHHRDDLERELETEREFSRELNRIVNQIRSSEVSPSAAAAKTALKH